MVNRVTAVTMEPRGCIGDYDATADHYTLYAQPQAAHTFRSDIATQVLKVPESKVRVIAGEVGGSFGMKSAIFNEVPLVLLASKLTRRPVKWLSTRSEAFLSDAEARDNVTDAELALDKDGIFIGMRVKTIANMGAHLQSGTPNFLNNLGTLAGVYRTPAIHADVTAVYTHTNPVRPYRGNGRPEAAYVIERLVDLAAAQTGIDAVELRRRNLIPPEAMPFKTGLTFTYDCGEFEKVLDEGLRRADVAGFPSGAPSSEKRGKLRGLGISYSIERAGTLGFEGAEVRFDRSGALTLFSGSMTQGQGHETVFKQLVCDRLGVHPDQATYVQGDTDKVFFGQGTGGSRSATLAGSAFHGAMEKILDKGKQLAAHLLGVDAADVNFAEGIFSSPKTNRTLTMQDVARAAADPNKLPQGMEGGLVATSVYKADVENYPNGCHCARMQAARLLPLEAPQRNSRMHAVGLSVGDEPLQCLRQGGILTLTHAENPAQEQAAARNWRRNVERAGPVLLIVVAACSLASPHPRLRHSEIPAAGPDRRRHADGRRVAADPDAQHRHHRQHCERLHHRRAVRARDLGADDPLPAGRAADHADLRRAAERAEDRDRAVDSGVGRRRHGLEDRRRRVDRVLSDRHQHDGGLQGGRSRACRRVPLRRCERAADVLPPAAALRDALHLRGLADRDHARRPRCDRRRMARRLERLGLSRSLRQLQLQYRALVRGDHFAGGDRHDIFRFHVVGRAKDLLEARGKRLNDASVIGLIAGGPGEARWRVSMRMLKTAVAVAALMLTGAAHAQDKVIMRINFTPWAMHAQYYGGLAQGIYKAEGIDLEIRPPSAGQQNEVFIGTGREQFGVANADGFIRARGSGVPVVAVMADEPDTPFSVITLKKDKYTSPGQLKGKKISWFQSNVKGLLEPLLIKGGLTRNDIEYVNVARGAEVQMLAAGQVDAVFGYHFGQALTLDMRGFPTDVMPLKDHGVSFYGTVIYTSEQLLKSNPDLVKRFVRATIKSLIWTASNKEAAVAEVIKVSPDRDLKLETKKLEIIYGLYNTPDYAQRFGLMNDAKWQSSIDILAAEGTDLAKKPPAKEMYTNAIVESIDEAKTLADLVKKVTH